MYPFALVALVIAIYFMAAALQRPRPAEILALVLWAAYAVYEYYVANGTLCDPYCNIRVDLVLFIPLLAGATYLAMQEQPRAGAVAIMYVICLGLTALLASAFGYKILAVIVGVTTLFASVWGIKSAWPGKRG